MMSHPCVPPYQAAQLQRDGTLQRCAVPTVVHQASEAELPPLEWLPYEPVLQGSA